MESKRSIKHFSSTGDIWSVTKSDYGHDSSHCRCDEDLKVCFFTSLNAILRRYERLGFKINIRALSIKSLHENRARTLERTSPKASISC